MANPQCENGYTRIANELLEALAKIRIPGEAMQVFLVIVRKTYGFGKKEDAIPLSQFCLATGLKRPNVVRAIKLLERMNLVIKSDTTLVSKVIPPVIKNDTRTVRIYRFNKDFEAWKPLSKTIPPSINSDNRGSIKSDTLKRNIQKKIYTSDSVEVGLSEKLLSLIRQRNENFKQPNIQQWASHVDKMIRIDKRILDEIERVIRWCQADAFWQNNILSTEKLRKQYDRLCMLMTGSNGGQVVGRQRYY